jgi:hypothetical protein
MFPQQKILTGGNQPGETRVATDLARSVAFAAGGH